MIMISVSMATQYKSDESDDDDGHDVHEYENHENKTKCWIWLVDYTMTADNDNGSNTYMAHMITMSNYNMVTVVTCGIAAVAWRW